MGFRIGYSPTGRGAGDWDSGLATPLQGEGLVIGIQDWLRICPLLGRRGYHPLPNPLPLGRGGLLNGVQDWLLPYRERGCRMGFRIGYSPTGRGAVEWGSGLATPLQGDELVIGIQAWLRICPLLGRRGYHPHPNPLPLRRGGLLAGVQDWLLPYRERGCRLGFRIGYSSTGRRGLSNGICSL